MLSVVMLNVVMLSVARFHISMFSDNGMFDSVKNIIFIQIHFFQRRKKVKQTPAHFSNSG
jgi:hypothetical protein